MMVDLPSDSHRSYKLLLHRYITLRRQIMLEMLGVEDAITEREEIYHLEQLMRRRGMDSETIARADIRAYGGQD